MVPGMWRALHMSNTTTYVPSVNQHHIDRPLLVIPRRTLVWVWHHFLDKPFGDYFQWFTFLRQTPIPAGHQPCQPLSNNTPYQSSTSASHRPLPSNSAYYSPTHQTLPKKTTSATHQFLTANHQSLPVINTFETLTPAIHQLLPNTNLCQLSSLSITNICQSPTPASHHPCQLLIM